MSYVIFGFCLYSKGLVVNLKMKSVEDPPHPRPPVLHPGLLHLGAPLPPASPLGWAPLSADVDAHLGGAKGYGKLVMTSKGVLVPNPEICELAVFTG